METIKLSNGFAALELVPEMGGGIARLDVAGEDGAMLPVLRPWSGNPKDGPFALACNILVPFSNRISDGGFTYQGKHYSILPNLDGEKFPIHGDGFQISWNVKRHDENQIELHCETGEIGPYRYIAKLQYTLSKTSLLMELEVKNTSGRKLPFGAGFHPWFPRNKRTRLQFEASAVWLEDEKHLPTKKVELAERPEWDFSTGNRLPANWINNCFTNWTGSAAIKQGENAKSVIVTASKNLNSAIVFSPDENADFFCFEPVSHPVNAHNLKGHPSLVGLNNNESLKCWMEMKWTSQHH